MPIIKVVALLSICAVVSGCVSTSEIVPMGKDSYMLSATSRGGLNAGSETIDGAKAANKYCDSLGKHMIVRRVDTHGVAGWTPVQANFIFSCLDDTDPEYQRPNLRQEPNIKIEDGRSAQ